MRCLIIIFPLVVLSPALSFGSLTWENQTAELLAKPPDRQMSGLFRFTNTGDFPVTLTALQPSCGCTTAELTKRTCLPSGKGEIKAVYKLNGATGQQQKSIAVTTDDTTVKTVELTLRINVPELFTCLPRMLLWRIGDNLDEKKAAVFAASELKLNSVEILTITPQKQADAHLERDPVTGKFTLFIHPISSLSASQTAVSCLANFADGTTLPFSVFALVR